MTYRFRIREDSFAGYEVQVQRSFYVFTWWRQISRGGGFGTNTNNSIERAKELANDWVKKKRTKKQQLIEEFDI